MNIRNIVICIIESGNKIFVGEGSDKVKGETFYRPLGGGIEFGELAWEAAVREFREEMDTEIEIISCGATLENIFEFEGVKGHEIVIVLHAKFKDAAIYTLDDIKCNEEGAWFLGKWIDKNEFYSGRKILYPSGLAEYLRNPAIS